MQEQFSLLNLNSVENKPTYIPAEADGTQLDEKYLYGCFEKQLQLT